MRTTWVEDAITLVYIAACVVFLCWLVGWFPGDLARALEHAVPHLP